MLKKAVSDIANVELDDFDGLTVNYVLKKRTQKRKKKRVSIAIISLLNYYNQ